MAPARGDDGVIERIDGLDDGVVGMRVRGTFSVDDYRDTIEPELERLEKAGDHELRLLLHLGPEFTGFGEGAWGDLTDELRRTHFHRGAVVTDDVAIRTGVALLRWTLHGHVRSFDNGDYGRAVDWVSN